MTTINKAEIQKFSDLAEEWWDVKGKFKPLHMFNPIRIEYIVKNIKQHFNINNNKNNFLKNLNILDIGCGGGLISEPMSRLGGLVTGIDASEKNIKVAKLHANKKLKINYICSSPEKLKIKKKFDVILNLEIVEHVDNVNYFIKKSSQFLKNDGLMFVATLNKTLKSYLFAIIGAEYILNWLPIGTHDWLKFVEPDKLKNICENNGLKIKEVNGFKYNILFDKWDISKDTSVNYISVFEKI